LGRATAGGLLRERKSGPPLRDDVPSIVRGETRENTGSISSRIFI